MLRLSKHSEPFFSNLLERDEKPMILRKEMLITFLITGSLFFGASFASLAQQPEASPKPAPAKPRALPTDTKAWKGDFDGMVKRRHIRVVVPYSRTLYFNDKGRERGLTADNVRDFEGYINKKYQKQLGNRPITVYLVPTTRDLLLQKVADGLGDNPGDLRRLYYRCS